MHLIRISTTLLLSVLAVASVSAQSIEDSYANQCTDAAAAKSETCAALRQALITKLQSQSSAASSPAAATPIIRPEVTPATPPVADPAPAQASPSAETLALWRKRFGFYADMVDQSRLGPKPSDSSL
jgi:PAB1-binding protein PBP1